MADYNNNKQQQKKSFEELAAEVKNQYFKNDFDNILMISQTKQLDTLINQIEHFVEHTASKLSASQLRNIYDKVLKAQTTNELKLMRPQLAYIAAKESSNVSLYNKDKVKSFFAFFDLLIQKVDSINKMEEFKTFFEAVVAYHKFYGKK